MSIGFYNVNSNRNENNKLNPSNYSINEDIVTMRFTDEDISLVVSVNRYVLIADESSYIKYNLKSNMIETTSNKLKFKTPNSIIVEYTPMQIARFEGVFDLIKSFALNPSIRIEKSTDILVDEIVDWHKENIVNNMLDLGEFARLKILMDNGMI